MEITKDKRPDLVWIHRVMGRTGEEILGSCEDDNQKEKTTEIPLPGASLICPKEDVPEEFAKTVHRFLLFLIISETNL